MLLRLGLQIVDIDRAVGVGLDRDDVQSCDRGARRVRAVRGFGNETDIAMRLPAVWLTPGTYTAGLRRLDAEPSAEVFSFRVVP